MLKNLLSKKITINLLELDLLTFILLVSGVVLGLMLFASGFVNKFKAAPTTVNWSQTDWSGGQNSNVTTTNVNTYSEISNINTSTSGEIKLNTLAGWPDANWQYRRPIVINSTNTNNQTEYQVLVTLTSGTFNNYANVQADCDDIRFATLAGGSFIPHYQLSCNTSGTSQFWVQIPTITASTNTTIYIYYGNSGATSASSIVNTFSYTTEKTVGYLVTDRINNAVVMSLENGNSISHNGSQIDLDSAEIGSIGLFNKSAAITAKKLFTFFDPDINSDTYVPVSFAGTEFLFTNKESGTENEEFEMLAPWGNATVTIYANGVQCDSRTVTAAVTVSGTGCRQVFGTTFRIISTTPILVYYDGAANQLAPILPATTEPQYGVPSRTLIASAGTSASNITLYRSDQASGTNSTINANTDLTQVNTYTTFAQGPAVKITTDTLLGAHASNDSDGADGVHFMPESSLGTKFGAGVSTDYIAIAAPTAVTCTVFNPAGTQIGTGTATSSNSQVYKLRFGPINGSVFTATGWYMNCSGPAYVYFEKSTDSESQAWSYLQMRQFTYPTPTVGTPGSETTTYEGSAHLVSNIFDAGYGVFFQNLTYNLTGTGTTTVKVRSSDQSNMSGATDWASCNGISSGSTISGTNCVTDNHRYIQYRIDMTPSGALAQSFQDINLAIIAYDQTVPTTNATNIQLTGITTAAWTNIKPTITWTAGVDNVGGVGIAGYCIALDEATINLPADLDPTISSGKLTGIDDGISLTDCPYIATGTSLNLNTISGLTLTSGKQYYISIKALDLIGNVWTGAANDFQNLTSFKYDNTPPSVPTYLTLPGNYISTKNVSILWPSVGPDAAIDSHSGLSGLQYRIGDAGIWYGDVHNGNQNSTDLLNNDGSYTTSPTYDYDSLVEGTNIIYFRTLDNAGNFSSAYASGTLRINTTAPSEVRNLTVNPSTNTVNAYSFEWDAPTVFSGQASNIVYCYTVNSLPNSSNCNFTASGVTNLNSDAFATQPSVNTMYIVAKDEAGNINYEVYETIDFSYTGSAPGIPRNVEISDISVRATENWRLALSWDVPEQIGAGVSSYKVYRSLTATSCSDTLTNFTLVGSSNSTSFVDTNLSQQTYNYCIKACDSANNCSAVTPTISKTPTGRFTSAPILISEPMVSDINTRRATVNWITDRNSDSKIQYGLTTNEYFTEEISNSNDTLDHTVTLNNLQPGQTYYFRAKWTDEDGNTGVSEELSFTTLPAPQIINMTATQIRTNSALITLTVKDSIQARMFYGPTTSYGGVSNIPTSPVESTYNVQLDNLSDGTIYNFKLILFDRDGFEYDTLQNNSFTTIARPRISEVFVEEIKNAPQPTVDISWTSNTPVSSIVSYYPVDNPADSKSEIVVDLAQEHKINLTNLAANTRYAMVISGIDLFGNEGRSEEFIFNTATDSRPPTISKIKVGKNNVGGGIGSTENSQLVVSWTTDEDTNSQVEYGEGANAVYTNTTPIDSNLKTQHSMVINTLRPGTVYNIRVASADGSGNISRSRNVVTITEQSEEDPLELVLGRLSEIFNFLR